MIWNIKKQKTTNQKNKKKKELQKYEDSVSSHQDNFKYSSIGIIGVPEGEKEEQGIRNRFEKIMKEKVPNLVKE